jgi:hypothetical protein
MYTVQTVAPIVTAPVDETYEILNIHFIHTLDNSGVHILQNDVR